MTSKTHPYYQCREFSATLRDELVRFVSKPGLPRWDQVTVATVLLADTVEHAPQSRALVLGCGHGALAVALARQVGDGEVWLTDTSVVALAMAERTLRANEIGNARVHRGISVLPERSQAFDIATLEPPKDRRLARRLLVEAHLALKPGGRLHLAGANDDGIQSIIKDADSLFGNATVIAYKKGNRVAVAAKEAEMPGDVPWAKEPGVWPGTWQEFELPVRDQHFRLRTLPGVFAHDRLDAGTRLLLEHLDVPDQAHVLDVGCGHGAVGLVAARLGAAQVDMVDADLYAVAAASESIALNRLTNARVFASDLLSAVGQSRYDLIVSNPPFHVGKKVELDVAHALIQDARRVLKPDGKLVIVANKFIRYDLHMRAAYRKVEILGETASYQVFAATKPR